MRLTPGERSGLTTARAGRGQPEAVLEVPVAVVEHDEGQAAGGSQLRREVLAQVLEPVDELVSVVLVAGGIARIGFGQDIGNSVRHRPGIHRVEPDVQVEGTLLGGGVTVLPFVVVFLFVIVAVTMVVVTVVVPMVLARFVVMAVIVIPMVLVAVVIVSMAVIHVVVVTVVGVHVEGSPHAERPADQPLHPAQLDHAGIRRRGFRSERRERSPRLRRSGRRPEPSRASRHRMDAW